MKIAILGAASARAPLVLTAIVKRQKRLGLTDLALMDLQKPGHFVRLTTGRGNDRVPDWRPR